ncbi:SAM-dependent methyltransferase [Saccharothrix mutabilis subsp. mutabilis]|uniref:SAM-dependent methyltransferase n=1 Tax=Saccharothrix mutabilis subsp. mutabilis TaxID=66855 RepID=A0ABP3E332_9PSEU
MRVTAVARRTTSDSVEVPESCGREGAVTEPHESFPLPGVDLQRPSDARVYDYLLGGTANWAVDREFADRALAGFPELRDIARANRQFLQRAVRYLVLRGVRQFIDIGSGVPNSGHTHQVADEVAPGATRVVYVDNEPVAVSHSRILVEDNGDAARHAVVHADLRDPDTVWREVGETGVLDLTRPVALLVVAVLHVHQPGADNHDLAPSAIARYRALIAPGSHLVLSHVTDDGVPETIRRKLARLKQRCDACGSPVVWRSRAEIESLFGKLRLVEPGLTWTPQWRPDHVGPNTRTTRFDTPAGAAVLAAVGVR